MTLIDVPCSYTMLYSMDGEGTLKSTERLKCRSQNHSKIHSPIDNALGFSSKSSSALGGRQVLDLVASLKGPMS